MNDMPLELWRPSGDWPIVLATQWKIRLFGPTGCWARPDVRFHVTASTSSELHDG
jgi:hypothetical protein